MASFAEKKNIFLNKDKVMKSMFEFWQNYKKTLPNFC